VTRNARFAPISLTALKPYGIIPAAS